MIPVRLRRGYRLLMALLVLPAAVAAQLPELTLAAYAGGFARPVHINHAGDGSDRLFVVEQAGRIRIVKDGTVVGTPFLDIRSRVSCCGERGLLSVAFPTGFAGHQRFYVYYTDLAGSLQISRFRVTGSDPDQADPLSEQKILTIPHPSYANHNGGQLAFGPDGYLYIGTGDGGSGGDPFGNGQNPAALLGKLLRIDVETDATPYAVPADNPFVGEAGYAPEIWALGLRNPWRFSFDRVSGDLYIADVGQNNYEEVNVQAHDSGGGENYGWNVMEGAHCYASPSCSAAGLTLPATEYDHSLGCSITGGQVYRGAAAPLLAGTYLFGDYCSGRIWGLQRNGSQWQSAELQDTGLSIATFGVDEAGEVYVADIAAGAIYRVQVVVPFVAGDVAPRGAPDGIVNAADALLVTVLALGRETPTPLDVERGDLAPVDGPDGTINAADALVVTAKALGVAGD